MSDLEKYMSQNPAASERYPQPGWFTDAGQLDRRKEAEHNVRMRQAFRDAEAVVAEAAVRLAGKLARMEEDERAVFEAKFKLHKAKKATLILADDSELQAKFAVLDDELFQRFRVVMWDDR